MFFHLPDHIYATFFNKEILALDLIKNQYVILSKELSNLLFLSLEYEFYRINNKYLPKCSNRDTLFPLDFDEGIVALREMEILSLDDYENPYPKKVGNRGGFSSGVSNIDWQMEYGSLEAIITKKMFIEAYITLIKVYFILKISGLYHLVRCVQKKSKGFVFIEKRVEEFSPLVTALNRACFYFPKRVKCLEWSAALVFMALKRKWKCNIEIGVQNLPFMAHAWVKTGNRVIADEPHLPNELSVILSEPFM